MMLFRRDNADENGSDDEEEVRMGIDGSER